MTLKVSRRSILAHSSTGVAVAALPSLALSNESTDNDAPLLALKPRFDRLFNEWVRLKNSQYAEHEEFEARHENAFGFERADAPAVDWDDPSWITYQEALHTFLQEDAGAVADGPTEWDRFIDAFHPLADQILAHKAAVLEGLRLQMRALISAYDETWNPIRYDDDEPQDPWLRDFVRSACNVLGVPFPPLPDGVR